MHPRSMNCQDRLPDLPVDRYCTCIAEHGGAHNDGAVTWESVESAAVREAVTRVEAQLLADAPRAARMAVLGAVEGGIQQPAAPAPPTRQQRRAAMRSLPGGRVG